jgi:hypothetical protein
VVGDHRKAEPCSSGQDVPTFDGRFVDTLCINKLLLAPQACRTAILALADHTFTMVFQVQVSILVNH